MCTIVRSAYFIKKKKKITISVKGFSALELAYFPSREIMKDTRNSRRQFFLFFIESKNRNIFQKKKKKETFNIFLSKDAKKYKNPNDPHDL